MNCFSIKCPHCGFEFITGGSIPLHIMELNHLSIECGKCGEDIIPSSKNATLRIQQ